MSTTDARRAAELRRMKAFATGLLVAMALVFLAAFALQDQHPWLQYLRAAAEGGMVGALADWFAVSALFRHPMGLKIPHTAIIPRRKDQIGASLGEFVEENFLSEAVVRRKLGTANIAARAGAWLATPSGADRVAAEGAVAIRGALAVLDDAAVQGVVERLVRKHLVEPPWGPPAGRMAARVLADGHHHRLVDLLVDRAAEWLRANYDVVSRLVAERSPAWAPAIVDGLVGHKVYLELSRFVRAVQDDQQHEVRLALDRYLKDLAHDLQHDAQLMARADEIKEQLLDDPRVRELAAGTWQTLKGSLVEGVSDANSSLTAAFTSAVRDLGRRLAEDPSLAARVDQWICEAAVHLVRNFHREIAAVISETVERWDAVETSRKIELQVGRDLQFIRLNGTVVGALAGLVLFTLAHAVFG